MKKLVVVGTVLFSCFAFADDLPSGSPSGQIASVQSAMDRDIRQGIRALPAWASLTNDRAAYLADKADYTNKVEQVSDANAKRTIKALAAMVQDLQAQINALKRIQLATINSTTNNAVINR